MKKTVRMLLLVMLVVTALVCFAFSSGAIDSNGECGENVSYTYDSTTGTLVLSGNGAMENYYTYRTSPFQNSDIKAVVVEDGVTSIGSYAFSGCSALETITLSESVTAINENAFSGCGSLDTVYAADAEAWLGISFYCEYDADEDCIVTSNPLSSGADLYFGSECVTELEIPASVTEIKSGAFFNCDTVSAATIPVTVTRIGQAAFYGCDSLKEITIRGSGATIGYEAFRGCNNLENLIIENGVTSIGANAFRECYKLSEVTIPASMKSVATEAFSGCMDIKKVYAADAGSWAGISFAPYKVGDLYNFSSNPLFYGAELYIGGKLAEKLEIPASVTEIKAGTFCNCKSIKSVVIPVSVKAIGERAFYGCNISGVYYNGSDSQWKKVSLGADNNGISNATIKFASVDLGKTSSITATQNTSAIKLTWKAVSGANVYRVYQKIGGVWTKLSDVTATSYTVSKLKAGTKYSFAVKAGKKSGSQITWAETYTTLATATKSVKPSKVTSAQNTSEIKLSWTACAGATGYRIYYKSGSTWKVSVSTTSATSHTFKNLAAGSKYTFAVRPYILVDGVVIWSEYTEYVAATVPAKVTAKTSSPAKGKISLTWNQVKGADGYQVFYKTNNGSYKLYKVVNASTKSMSFSNLKSGTKYTFVVRAGIKTGGGNIYGAYKEAAVKVK